MTPAALPLRLELRPSRLLVGAFLLAHAIALVAAWLALEGWTRYLGAAAILTSLVACLRQAARQARSLELHEDGRISWMNREGTWQEGRLGEGHFVSAHLVIVELNPGEGGRNWLVLAPDSAFSEDFRRLRVRLRWGRSAAKPERNNLTED